MTTLVTGATGFVGSAVVQALVDRGRAVRRAVRHMDNSPTETVEIGDIDERTDWSGALTGVATIIHCAARVHQMQDRANDPLDAFRRVNTAGTLALAQQAAASGVHRLIFLSSVKVNGEETVLGKPFRPEDEPRPEDPYAVSKLEAEQGLRLLAGETGLEVTIIRPTLVYGPGVGANFAQLIRLVRSGFPLPLGSVTDNRRSMVALDNLVDFILATEAPAAANETFLVSDGDDVSTRDLLLRLARALGVRSKLIPVPPRLLACGATVLGRKNIAKRLLGSLQVNIDAGHEKLGWLPPIGLDEGLCRAVGNQSKE